MKYAQKNFIISSVAYLTQIKFIVPSVAYLTEIKFIVPSVAYLTQINTGSSHSSTTITEICSNIHVYCALKVLTHILLRYF